MAHQRAPEGDAEIVKIEEEPDTDLQTELLIFKGLEQLCPVKFLQIIFPVCFSYFSRRHMLRH